MCKSCLALRYPAVAVIPRLVDEGSTRRESSVYRIAREDEIPDTHQIAERIRSPGQEPSHLQALES